MTKIKAKNRKRAPAVAVQRVVRTPVERMAEALFLTLSCAYRKARAKDYGDTAETPPPTWNRLITSGEIRDKNETKAYRAAAKWLLSIGARCPNVSDQRPGDRDATKNKSSGIAGFAASDG